MILEFTIEDIKEMISQVSGDIIETRRGTDLSMSLGVVADFKMCFADMILEKASNQTFDLKMNKSELMISNEQYETLKKYLRGSVEF